MSFLNSCWTRSICSPYVTSDWGLFYLKMRNNSCFLCTLHMNWKYPLVNKATSLPMARISLKDDKLDWQNKGGNKYFCLTSALKNCLISSYRYVLRFSTRVHIKNVRIRHVDPLICSPMITSHQLMWANLKYSISIIFFIMNWLFDVITVFEVHFSIHYWLFLFRLIKSIYIFYEK